MDRTSEAQQPPPTTLLSLPASLLVEIAMRAAAAAEKQHQQRDKQREESICAAFASCRALRDAVLACTRASCTVTLPSQQEANSTVRVALQVAQASSSVGGRPLQLTLRSNVQPQRTAAHHSAFLLGGSCHHHHEQHPALRGALAAFLERTLVPAALSEGLRSLTVVSLQHLVLDSLLPPELTQALPCLQQLHLHSACLVAPLRAPLTSAALPPALVTLTLRHLDWHSAHTARRDPDPLWGAAVPPPLPAADEALMQAHCEALSALSTLRALSVHCCRLPSAGFVAALVPRLSVLALEADMVNTGLAGALAPALARQSCAQALAALPLAGPQLTRLTVRLGCSMPLAPSTLASWAPAMGSALACLMLPELKVSQAHLEALLELHHMTKLVVRSFDDSCCLAADLLDAGSAASPHWLELGVCSHSLSLLALPSLPLARLQRPLDLQRLVLPAVAWPLCRPAGAAPQGAHAAQRQQAALERLEHLVQAAAACPARALVQLMSAPRLCCDALASFSRGPSAAALLAVAARICLLPAAGTVPGGGVAGNHDGAGTHDSPLTVADCQLLWPGVVAQGLGAWGRHRGERALLQSLCLMDSCLSVGAGGGGVGGVPAVSSWLAQELAEAFPALVALELCDCTWYAPQDPRSSSPSSTPASSASSMASDSDSDGGVSSSSTHPSSGSSATDSGIDDEGNDGQLEQGTRQGQQVMGFLLDLARCFGRLRASPAPIVGLLPRLEVAVVSTEDPTPVWHSRLSRRLPQLQQQLRAEGLAPLVRVQILTQ